MVSIDDKLEVLHGLFKEPIIGPYDDLECQQTSPRDPQENLAPFPTANLASFPAANPREKLHPREICASGGALLVVPHLLQWRPFLSADECRRRAMQRAIREDAPGAWH